MVDRISWMRRYQRYFLVMTFLLLDYLAVIVAEHSALAARNALAVYWQGGHYVLRAAYLYFWVPLLFLLFLSRSQVYQQMRPILDTIRDIFYSVVYGVAATIIMLYVFRGDLQVSRLYLALFSVFVLLSIYMFRYITLKALKLGRFFEEPVVLIGAGKTAECLLRFFAGDLGYRYDIIGLIDDAPISAKVAGRFLLLGRVADAEQIVRDAGVQTVLIAAPGMERDRIQELIVRIQPYVKDISFIPDLIGTPMAGAQVDILFSEKILMLKLQNNLARKRNRVFKRVFDIVCTLFGSVVLSPLLLLLVIIVAVENHGHVIFVHPRVGQDGRMFPCYKFQTMVPDAEEKLAAYLAAHPAAREEWQENFKLAHDPRVTKFGAFLRRTSLDELPQIVNVLKGEMSLVGPRPIVKEEVPRYGENIREYYMVPPGITGMWQASGRSDTTYEERVAMDTWYVRNWSVWVDLMYLFKTFKAVLTSKGAY